MLNVFELALNDQSVYYLGQIFGNVGLALTGTGPTLLPAMFKPFNLALLVVGIFMAFYTIIVGTMLTAHEGEFLGRDWKSLWVPLRIVIGIAGLIPTASGYCLIQVIFMWVVVQGVGAADTVWTQAMEYFSAGGAIFTSPSSSSFSDVADQLPTKLTQVFSNLACQSISAKLSSNDINAKATSTFTVEDNNIYKFGTADQACGSVEWPVYSAKDNPYGNAQTQAMQSIVPVLEILANYYVNQVMTADSGCWSRTFVDDKGKPSKEGECDPSITDSNEKKYCPYFGQYASFNSYCKLLNNPNYAAEAIGSYAGSNFMLDATKLFYGYAENYIVQNALKSGTARSVNYDEPVVNGWLFSGAYYYFIAKKDYTSQVDFNSFIQSIVPQRPKIVPGTTKSSIIDTVQKSAETVSNAVYQSADMAATAGGGGLTITSDQSIIPDDASSAFAPLQGAAIAVANSFASAITPDPHQDPLVKLHNFGHSLLIDADTLFVAFFGVGILLGLGATIIVALGNTVNVLQGISQFLQLFLIPLVFFFLLYLIIIGGLLGLYLPLLPYILYVFGVIGWFLAVIEAMVAAPVVAIGILSPGGHHQILGDAEPAAKMLLNVFLRPTLMVFGMLTAMLLAIVIVQFINAAFGSVVGTMLSTSSSPTVEEQIAAGIVGTATGAAAGGAIGAAGGFTIFGTFTASMGVFEALLLLIVYAGFILVALNKCYSLIHLLPERVITWIGGHGTSYGEAEALHEVRERASAGAGKVGESAGSAAGTAGELAKARLEAKAKEKKEATTPSVKK